ncbi:MAG: type II toxin-antitoxin system Phd/YefM family antitoxin [Pseudomonadota bacterium]
MPKVTSTQFMKTPGVYQDQAQREPVMVMKHNREHTVLLSAEEYHRLKRRDRQVFRTGELSDADLAAIAAAEPPAEAAAHDDEYPGGRT